MGTIRGTTIPASTTGGAGVRLIPTRLQQPTVELLAPTMEYAVDWPGCAVKFSEHGLLHAITGKTEGVPTLFPSATSSFMVTT